MTTLPQSWVPWIDLLGWTLLHFLWQGVAIGIIYLVLRPLFNTVASRYRFGMSALVLLALCPFATVAWLWPSVDDLASVVPASASAIELAAVGTIAAATEHWHFVALLPWLVGAWFVGVLFIALRAFLHWRRLNWLVHFASAPVPECREALADLCKRFGIRRPVRLLASLRVGTPMLIGWLKPVILLPASMLVGFTPHQIELIVAHELGHVRRWDYLANLLQVVIETVLFYHPVVHWISRDVRNARESCCDDLVLALADGTPIAYARTLADLEELRHDAVVAAPALAANGGVLLARIRRIVGMQRDFYDPLPRNNSVLLVLIAAAGVLFGAMRLHSVATPAALVPAAAESLALISGNPTLAAPPVARSEPAPTTTIAKPVVSNPPADRAVETKAPESEVVVDRVARPHIEIASLARAPAKIENIGLGRISVPAPAPALVSDESPTEEAPAIVRPTLVRVVQPNYPPRELLAGATGKVALEFSINADGTVHDVRTVGPKVGVAFQEAAIAALNEWKFSTAAPIDSKQRYTQTFAFNPPSVAEGCHEVIGSHICRRSGE